MLFAIIAKANGSSGVKKSTTEIKVYVGWPTRTVISFLALLPVGLFFLDPERTWAASLALVVVVLPLVLSAWLTELRISDEGLFSRTPWRRSKFVAWEEIITVGSVSNGGGWNWRYIDTTNKGKVRWDRLIDGEEYIDWALDRFAPHAIRKTSKFFE